MGLMSAGDGDGMSISIDGNPLIVLIPQLVFNQVLAIDKICEAHVPDECMSNLRLLNDQVGQVIKSACASAKVKVHGIMSDNNTIYFTLPRYALAINKDGSIMSRQNMNNKVTAGRFAAKALFNLSKVSYVRRKDGTGYWLWHASMLQFLEL